jgi:hypothetical protein
MKAAEVKLRWKTFSTLGLRLTMSVTRWVT